MGIRGELFTNQVQLDNRSYFFNVKENRAGDVFLQIVESKKGDGSDFDRHQVCIFAEDMQKVFGGLDEAIKFIEKERKSRAKARAEKKAAKEAKFGHGANEKLVYKKKGERAADPVKKTGKVIHIKSKKTEDQE